jgi:glutaredoxin-like YruB-family protein
MEDVKVTVFSTPTCPFCKKTKEFLTQKGIEYTDHDVTSDNEALEEMRRLTEGGLSVPVIKIGDEVIVGFDKGRIEELLG